MSALSIRAALVVAAVASAVLTLFAAPATATPAALPQPAYTFAGSQVFPEGLDADARHLYSTSFADGTIYRGDVRGSVMRPFLRGGPDGRTSAAGIRVDGDRLLVAGGKTGRFFVYTATGSLVATYVVADPSAPTLINDAAIAPNGDVYVTDSYRPVVYRISAAQVRAPATRATRALTVAYALPDYLDGQSNGNGIVATPDGRSLLIGYYQSGQLYRLDLNGGRVTPIRLPFLLTSADGMLLEGRTMRVARAATNVVTTLRVTPDYSAADVVDQRGYPGMDTPTGLVRIGDRLLVTNSQLDTLFFGAPQTSPTFTLGQVPLGRGR